MSAPVTMAEIDRARARANRAVAVRRECAADGSPPCDDCFERVHDARERVEALLRRWWAQGCREVPRG